MHINHSTKAMTMEGWLPGRQRIFRQDKYVLRIRDKVKSGNKVRLTTKREN